MYIFVGLNSGPNALTSAKFNKENKTIKEKSKVDIGFFIESL